MLPGGSTMRPAVPDDAAEVAALIAADEMRVLGFVEYAEDDVREDWGLPGIELERDTRVIVAGDGSIAAYQWCFKRGERPVCFWVEHPSHLGRGLGETLAERAEQWAVERGSSSLQCVVRAADEPAGAMLRARGYEVVRHFWRMERKLSRDDVSVDVSSGVVIREIAPSESPVVHDLIERSFTQNWGFVPRTPAQWRAEFVDAEGFDPSLWFVAEIDGAVAGAVVGWAYPKEGFVKLIGVDARARGRGIGRALLKRSFASFASRGLPLVALYVDAGNETGAKRLYESVGMEVRVQNDYYEKQLS